MGGSRDILLAAIETTPLGCLALLLVVSGLTSTLPAAFLGFFAQAMARTV